MGKRYISWSEFVYYVDILRQHVKDKGFKSIYGIPRGGTYVAILLSRSLNLPIISEKQIDPKTLIVDDIIDSGKTIEKYREYYCMALFCKPHSTNKAAQEVTTDWIIFPWEENEAPAEDAVVRMIEALGDNPNREGLIDTPKRVIKSWNELYCGYEQKAEDVLKTTFEEGSCKEMVVLKNIEFYSTCEHHLLPFFGKISIGYIPDKKVVGISKLARLSEMFARRLQIQENMTTQIAESIMKYLEPKGCMVIAEAQHFCIVSRGIKKANTKMITSAMRGVFEKTEVRQEFMSLIKE